MMGFFTRRTQRELEKAIIKGVEKCENVINLSDLENMQTVPISGCFSNLVGAILISDAEISKTTSQNGIIVQKDLYMQNKKENDSYLKTALQSLSNASQTQFEEMKNEKWYHRVFDLVTFSQKGQKRVAEQISTLSQAQQVFAEMLVFLSDSDAALNEMIRENAGYIHQLADQNAQLALKMKSLEQSIKYGATRCYDVNILSDSQKKLLVFCLYYLAQKQKNPSKYQKEFVNRITKYARQEIMDFDEDKMIEQLESIIDIDVKKVILMSCLEYLFLNQSSENRFLESREEVEFLYHFDCGEKTVNQLKSYIVKTYKAVGEEGILNKYSEEVFCRSV